MNELSPLARVRDEELAGQASGAGARALLTDLLATDPDSPAEITTPAWDVRSRRRGWWARRLLVTVVAAAALAAGTLIVPGVLTGPATAVSYTSDELDITQVDGQWVARIKDPYAEHEKYTRGFSTVGLRLKLELVPVSPSQVGMVVEQSAAGGALRVGREPENCALETPGCALVIRIPVGFAEAADVKFGRGARPGEGYALPGPANGPGEP
ncbi:hypothetical protein HII36_42060, partial [Nonomuraea sp. NN258]|nr:hypothetical protein [Nonomuraea antri]